MFDKKALADILAVALTNGGDFAEIFLERRVINVISCEQDHIERINSGTDAGVGIRVIAGDTTAYAYTNKLTGDELRRVAEIASRAAKGGKKEYNLDLTQLKPVVDFTIEQPPDEVKMEEKVRMVEVANAVARGTDPRIRQVQVGYGDVVQHVTIANSDGQYVEDERVRTRMLVNAIAVDGPVMQTGYEAIGQTSGFEIFKRYPPEELARTAAQRAIAMLEAKPAPAGKMPVVMAGEAGGTMVHEACGHGLEADLVQKGLSVYAGKMGQEVASPLVTVVDDGTLAGKYGTLRFDDEGTPTQKTVLIDRGILREFMYDRFTASRDNKASTGNGRRESYQHKPIPRMRNTYIAPGDTPPEKIIGSVKNGLLVKKMGGGQVNTVNGDFVFDVAEGYLIKDGKVSHAVRGATLTGNGPEVLKTIDMVGSDIGFAIGTCGKDGQGVPVADAQPTIKIPQMIVGGTEHADLAGAGPGGPPALARLWEKPGIKRIRRR